MEMTAHEGHPPFVTLDGYFTRCAASRLRWCGSVMLYCWIASATA
jgi:hypothetical protein